MSGPETKGNSPFYPNHPVPPELFTGRATEIDLVMTRGVGQTSRGKPMAFFVAGEYGIGKSSIAAYLQKVAERDHGLIGIRADLAGARNLADVAAAVLAGAVRTGAYDLSRREQVKNWLGRYVGKQTLFGVTINLETLTQDAPSLASAGQILDFLREVRQRFTTRQGAKGVFLVLDEINGIAAVPEFAHFLKSTVDTNSPAISQNPLPLLLMVCGTEERRREIVTAHEPTNRIFTVVDVPPLADADVATAFATAFATEGYNVAPDAAAVMVRAAAGLPKVMHLIGDKVYFRTAGRTVDMAAAINGILDAADEVGRQFVDHQILSAIQGADYQAMLGKLALKIGPFEQTFTRKELAAELTEAEQRKLGNFLTRLKALSAIRQAGRQGKYEFCSRMVQTYLWLRGFRQSNVPPANTAEHVIEPPC